MKIDILTLFPEMVQPYLDGSILGRAKAQGHQLNAVQLRDFAAGKHAQVDDTPYGGGAGMVLMVEPIHKAVKNLVSRLKKKKTCVILTAASGEEFRQADARMLAEKYDHLIFICGRYEGVDERVAEHVAQKVYSVGNYVLTGGELPALVMSDAVMRMVPGVLGNEESLIGESFNRSNGSMAHPQYTKPEVYNTWKVPEVLLSGHHKKIEQWREENRHMMYRDWDKEYCYTCGRKLDSEYGVDGLCIYCPKGHQHDTYGGGGCSGDWTEHLR